MTAWFVVLAGLMGAGGVVMLAAGAHLAPGTGLSSVGSILMFHAAAVMAAAAVTAQGLVWRPLALTAMAGLILGATLFGVDLTLRAFAGPPPVPGAAIGGIVMTVSWLALATAALVSVWRR
jgi:uncharacterized membrane protein YgdD (TMEM256/DUF423 family)